MIKKNEPVTSQILSKYIVKGIQEKKGVDIVIIDLKDIGNAIADYFVICTGTSDTQIEAIADSVEKETLKGAEEKPWHREGFQNKEWILLDYVNVVVHIFKNDVRSFYGLEELWEMPKSPGLKINNIRNVLLLALNIQLVTIYHDRYSK